MKEQKNNELEIEFSATKTKLSMLRKELHFEFVKNNKLFFRIADILFIIMILFNMGALVLTKVMVQERGYEEAYNQAEQIKLNTNTTKTTSEIVNEDLVEYKEANPFQAKINNLNSVAPLLGIALIMVMLRQAFFWAILSFLYMITRMNLRTRTEQFIFVLYICLFAFMLYYDFGTDLGLWIGKLIYSGG